MPMRRHPFFQAPAGAVFAIAIAPGKWGYVRFFRGCSMAVLSLVGSSPQMPNINWVKPPVGWNFFSFAPNQDKTEAIKLGLVPFPNEVAEWSPPCFVPPDVIDNCHKIHDKFGIRRATEAEIQGMNHCRTVTPTKLAEFLLDRLQAGELHEV